MASRLSVIVTSPLLAREGLALLEAAGIDPHYTEPFPKPERVAALARDIGAAAIIARQGGITAAVMDASPALRIIARHGAGVDEVDLEAARARGIMVTRTPGANARAVAEHALALMLALLKDLPLLGTQIAAGGWRRGDYWARDAEGLRLGLLGMGPIAQHTARLASAFGMEVAAFSRVTAPSAYAHAERVDSVEALLERSDILSLHTALTPETRGIIGRAALARMPRGGLLINTARGGLVDEAALLDALASGHLAGAALDVTEPEPPAPDHPFRQHPRIILTPHIAGVTAGSMRQMAVGAAECVVARLTGQPVPAERIVVPA
jgi:D-3-phosphoglycerate dehydrogenase